MLWTNYWKSICFIQIILNIAYRWFNYINILAFINFNIYIRFKY